MGVLVLCGWSHHSPHQPNQIPSTPHLQPTRPGGPHPTSDRKKPATTNRGREASRSPPARRFPSPCSPVAASASLYKPARPARAGAARPESRTAPVVARSLVAATHARTAPPPTPPPLPLASRRRFGSGRRRWRGRRSGSTTPSASSGSTSSASPASTSRSSPRRSVRRSITRSLLPPLPLPPALRSPAVRPVRVRACRIASSSAGRGSEERSACAGGSRGAPAADPAPAPLWREEQDRPGGHGGRAVTVGTRIGCRSHLALVEFRGQGFELARLRYRRFVGLFVSLVYSRSTGSTSGWNVQHVFLLYI